MTDQGPIVRYEAYNEEDFERDYNRAKGITGAAIMELQEGPNIVRFIPSNRPEVTPMRSTGMHFVDAIPGLDQTLVFACPKQELQQPCPVCLHVEELRRSANPVDRARADRVAVKLRVYANVVDRSAPPDDPQHGLRVLGFGKSVLEQLKTIRRNSKMGGDFFQPDPRGFDIVIVKEGEGMQTRYKVIPVRENAPLDADIAMTQALIDNQYDLNQYVNPQVPEEIITALQMTRQSYGLPRGAGGAPTPAVQQWAAQQPAHVLASVGQAQTPGRWPASAGGQASRDAINATGAPPAALPPLPRAPVGSGLFGGAPVQPPPATRVIVPGSSAAQDTDFTQEAPVNWDKIAESEAPPVEYDDDFNPIIKPA